MKRPPFGRIVALGLGLGAIFLLAEGGPGTRGATARDVQSATHPDMQLAQAAPDTGGTTTGTAPELQGIGLTASHKRIIYENVAGERTQDVSGGQKPAVGGTIPDSVMLNEMPIEVKDQVGLLRDFKFAKLPGDNIVIVDPASRKVVDIITKDEAGR